MVPSVDFPEGVLGCAAKFVTLQQFCVEFSVMSGVGPAILNRGHVQSSFSCDKKIIWYVQTSSDNK